MGDEDEYEGFRAGYLGAPPTSSGYRYRMGYQAGSWMREDEESTPTGGHCFIATAAFGTPLAPQLRVLRRFRDRHMAGGLGGAFRRIYYATSPPIARLVARFQWVGRLVRALLSAVISALERGTR